MSSRSLSYGDVAYTSFAQKWIDPPGAAAPYKSTSGWFPTASDYYSHLGVNTPNFHKRLNKGELIPFTSWKQFVTNGSCDAPTNELTSPTGYKSWWEGDRPLLNSSQYFFTSSDLFDYLDESDLTAEVNEYVQKSAASIAERGWDALTFLAELHKTVALFRNVVPRLIETIRRGRLDRAWLESRYGWRILLYDVEDINNTLKAINEKQKEMKFAKQRTGTNRSYSESKELVYTGGSGDYYFTREDEWDLSIRGNVIAAFKPPLIRTNVLSTIWEISYFSFVIDWFIDIGQWLSAMSFMMFQTDHTAAGGILASCKRSVSYDFTDWNTGWTGDYEFTSEATAEFTLRIPTSVPLVPLWKIDLDWLKVTDLVALLISFARKR